MVKNGFRNYSAAQALARYSDFKSSSGSADYELVEGLAEIRRKCRFLARNSGTMKRYIQLMRDNVVGHSGFAFQSRVKKQSGELDDTLNAKVEAAWRRWSKNPSMSGKMSMKLIAKQMVAGWCRDGEYILEVLYGPQFTDGVALNPIEPDLLDEYLNTTSDRTGNRIRMGVEIDQYDRPITYHFLTQHPGDISFGAPNIKNRYRQVPASRVIHVYDPLRAGQTRGEPPACAATNSIKMVDGYREAEVTNRRIAAAIMGFFTKSEPGPGELDALADDDTDNDGSDEFMMDVEPGRMKSLPEGMSFQEFSPGGSVTDYADFEAQVKKDISMSVGISTFALGMETEGVSYSTGRSVLQEDRDFYKGQQEFFIETGMQQIRDKFFMGRMLFTSDIPASRIAVVLEETRFRGRGWDWVDPSKDVSANAQALETHQTSYSEIAAKRGMDVRELFQEIADDQKMMKDFGLTPHVSSDKGEKNTDDEDEGDDDED